MPKPKKQKTPKKPKKAPAKKGKGSSGMRQTVKVTVRMREGAGGGGVPPIVYATYAPTPPAQLTQFLFDDGMPPAPVKQAPPHHMSTGVGADASTGTHVSIRDTLTGHERVQPSNSSDNQVRPRIKIIPHRKTPHV